MCQRQEWWLPVINAKMIVRKVNKFCLTCFGFCFTPSDFAFVQPINWFWQLCGWNLRALQVFLQSILWQCSSWETFMAWICTQWHSAIWLAVDVAAVNMIGKWRCIIKFCWCFIVTTRWSVHWWPATNLVYLYRCRKDSRTSFWSHTVWLQHIYVFMFAVFLRVNSVLCFFYFSDLAKWRCNI